MTLDTYWGLDIERVVLFPLFTSGVNKGGIAAVSDAAFEGYDAPGPVSLEFSFGNPRTIPNVSQGKVNDTIILPSVEAKSGVLRSSYDSQTLNALLSDTKITTMGLSKVFPEGTNREGEEIQCAMVVNRLVSHTDTGDLVHASEVFGKVTLVPRKTNFSDAALQKEYTIGFSQPTKYAWGETLSLATHGCTKATNALLLSDNYFNMIGWLGDCIDTTFELPADKPALTSSSAKVWNYVTGAAVAGTWNLSDLATVFTPTVTPDSTDLLICTYEYTK